MVDPVIYGTLLCGRLRSFKFCLVGLAGHAHAQGEEKKATYVGLGRKRIGEGTMGEE